MGRGGAPKITPPWGLYPTPAASSDHPGSTAPLPHRRGRRAGGHTETRGVCVCVPNNSSSDPAALGFVKPNVSQTTVWFSSPNKACCYFFPCAYAQNRSAFPLCQPHTRLPPPDPKLGPPWCQDLPHVVCPALLTASAKPWCWAFVTARRDLSYIRAVFFFFFPILPNNKLFSSKIRKKKLGRGRRLTCMTHREV